MSHAPISSISEQNYELITNKLNLRIRARKKRALAFVKWLKQLNL